MGKFIEVNLTEIFEVPDSWNVVEDDEGNMALKTQSDEFLDFETMILYANANGIDETNDVQWIPCIDDESFEMLYNKGLKQVKTQLDVFELEEDEVDFDEEEIL